MKTSASPDLLKHRLTRLEIGMFLAGGLLLEVIQGALMPSWLRVEVLLVLIIYHGWYASPLKAGVLGMLFGIAQDYFLGVYLGLNGLSNCLVGFSSSLLSRWTGSESGHLRLVLLAFLTVLDRMIIMGTLLILGQDLAPIQPLEILSTSLLTGAAGEVFFRLYDKIRFPPKDFRRLA